jgi:hypothetical protein
MRLRTLENMELVVFARLRHLPSLGLHPTRPGGPVGCGIRQCAVLPKFIVLKMSFGSAQMNRKLLQPPASRAEEWLAKEAERHLKISFLMMREPDAYVRDWQALKLSPFFTEM